MTEMNNNTSCLKCGVVKTEDNTTKNKNRPDGKNAYCKACAKIKSSATYLKHIESRKVRAKVAYETKKDEYKERAARWAEANREKRRDISKRYVKNNKEARQETSTAYRLANSGLYAAHFKMRQQRKRQAMPIWADPIKIGRIYKACARIVQVTGIKHHVDHYFPLKSDVVCGLHNEFNLRIITAFDNLSKSNALPE